MKIAQKIGLFGAALDPLPTKQSLLVKQAYLQAKAMNRLSLPDFSDPYAFFSDNLPHGVSDRFSLLGSVPMNTWLVSKPEIDDAPSLTLEKMSNFVRNGGCNKMAGKISNFVCHTVFPQTPGMIGVDHCLTYGTISALKEYKNCELGLIVLDSHFDAVPMKLRYGLMEYAQKNNVPYVSPDLSLDNTHMDFSFKGTSESNYLNCENFLLNILDEGLISPENIVVVGISDYPPKEYEESYHSQARDYFNYFKMLEKKGIRFIPKSEIIQNGTQKITEALHSLSAKQVYVSLDIDVGSISSVYACRFLNTMGLNVDQIKNVFQTIFATFSNDLTLAGFDLMEVDIHKLGAKINNSRMDRASEISSLFFELIGKVV